VGGGSGLLVLQNGTGVGFTAVGSITTDPIAGNWTAGQTFVVPCRDLYRMDVYFAAYDRADAPEVVFHLRDSPTSDRDLARVVRAPAPIAKALLNAHKRGVKSKFSPESEYPPN
jgi:hypothetical protein